jgi:hypothetical protein
LSLHLSHLICCPHTSFARKCRRTCVIGTAPQSPSTSCTQIYDSDAEIVLDRIFVDGIAVGRVCSELSFRGGRGGHVGKVCRQVGASPYVWGVLAVAESDADDATMTCVLIVVAVYPSFAASHPYAKLRCVTTTNPLQLASLISQAVNATGLRSRRR